MAPEATFHCPECEQQRSFELSARTHLSLGEKSKWQCTDCDHVIIRIDDTITTTAQA